MNLTNNLAVLIVSTLLSFQTFATEANLPTFDKLIDNSGIKIPSKRAIELIVLDEAISYALAHETESIAAYLKDQGFESYKAFSLMNGHSRPLLRIIELVNIRKDRQKALDEVRKPYRQAVEKEVALWEGSIREAGLTEKINEARTEIQLHIRARSPDIKKDELDTEFRRIFFKNESITASEANSILGKAYGIGIMHEEIQLLINGKNKPVETLIKQVTSEMNHHTLGHHLKTLEGLKGEYEDWQAQVEAM